MPAYLATLATFVALDAGWLSLVAIELFRHYLGPILREQPNAAAAIAFYGIYAAGLYVLAVRPSAIERSYRAAASYGAMVGLTAYATFDLTNLAIINGWTLTLALLDLAWGTAASAVAAAAGHGVATRARPDRRASGGQGLP